MPTSPDRERMPIEIKLDISTRRPDLRFIEQEGRPFGILIKNADEIRLLTENIIQIPAEFF